MYQQLLDKVFDEIKGSAGYEIRPPCPPERLGRLKRRAREQLGVELPAEYASFLTITDGLAWNGLYMYASEDVKDPGDDEGVVIDGLVELNLERRQFGLEKDLLALGNDSLRLYAYRVSEGQYVELDNGSLSREKAYPSFDAMMTEALNISLM
jgi:hypothetical protein